MARALKGDSALPSNDFGFIAFRSISFISLTLSPPDGKGATAHVLGPDLRAGCRPQVVVPNGWWQTAVSLGAWTLVGCTVAPGFRFEGFELAPPDWRPSKA